MIPEFSAAEKAVAYPSDRRFVIKAKPTALIIVTVIIALALLAAWLQYLIRGLPADPGLSETPSGSMGTAGFPALVRFTHWINFFFLILLVRSGLSILMDHPRLYWNNGCQPGSEWIRFTPLKVPADKVWTAKDDARYISPLIGLPGYRHTVGLARCWHFIHVPFFFTERSRLCSIHLFYGSLEETCSHIMANAF